MTFPTNPYIFGVNIIPASGEFIYDTVAYSGKQPGTSTFSPINTYFAPGGTQTDFEYCLDQLQQILPNCQFVALVVQWMGDSLDLSACQIYPSTTYWDGSLVGAFEPTAAGSTDGGLAPSYWRVSDLTLADCNAGLIPISRNSSGDSAYGGTCSDQSVVRAIQAIKARGLKCCLYLQMNMDAPGQPWRGMVTYSPDMTSTATTVVNNFFGAATTAMFTQDPVNLTVNYAGSKFDFTYRRFILHYANLAVIAGGVSLLTIGSEMRGIEAIRGPAWTPAGTLDGSGHAVWDYPAVAQLATLINDCRSVFDAAGLTKNLAARQNLITYSADWSQWMGAQHSGYVGIWPHLDPLYAMANCDLVSFDNYLPLSDWTTGGGGLDALNWNAPVSTAWPDPNPATMGIGLLSTPDIHDLGYLMFGLEHGEKADFYYGDYASSTIPDPKGSGVYVTAPQGDRLAQARNAYYAGQELFAFKKFRWWWNNSHYAVYDDGDGQGAVPHGAATAWVAQSKSIMWQEYGFASIDRDSNEENLFYNPGNVAGGTPFWTNWESASGGGIEPIRDDLMQFSAHKAWGTYWGPGNTNNVTSSGGVAMIATDMMFAWNWDARPFPAFPLRLDVWADGSNWRVGMWLAGKGPALPPLAPSPDPTPGAYPTFPALSTQGWSVHVTPKFSTGIAIHVSGRETRTPLRAYAYRDIELTYELLRADPAHLELQALEGFYLGLSGQDGAFWFAPPGLSALTAQPIGIGDGTTTAFPLLATTGSAKEPVQATSGVSAVYLNGAPQATGWSAGSGYAPAITFGAAPAAGVAVSADFGLLWLCRFAEDMADLENFMTLLWKWGSVKLQTVRP